MSQRYAAQSQTAPAQLVDGENVYTRDAPTPEGTPYREGPRAARPAGTPYSPREHAVLSMPAPSTHTDVAPACSPKYQQRTKNTSYQWGSNALLRVFQEERYRPTTSYHPPITTGEGVKLGSMRCPRSLTPATTRGKGRRSCVARMCGGRHEIAVEQSA